MPTPRRKKAKPVVGDPLPEPLPGPPIPLPPPNPPPCPCCFDCTGKAKGTLFFCDGNGGCTAIPPPVAASHLEITVTGEVYWQPNPT